MRVKRFLMAEAKFELQRRVAQHAALLRVAPAGLTVKDTRSRWGSCTADGTLSFSWRVILAPPYVLDYLAAHEVAHLAEMNHSARFWALVRRCAPDYARGRAWLRRHGQTLHAYGASD
jgi:predicted metal-dependent hydrolase